MKELVVLLHGLGRTPASMLALSLAARRHGYTVLNWHYRSTRAAIARAAVPRKKVAGMQDFLVLHRTHTTLPWSPHAIAAAFRLLEKGELRAG